MNEFVKKFDNRNNDSNYENTEVGKTLSSNAKIFGTVGTAFGAIWFIFKLCNDLIKIFKN